MPTALFSVWDKSGLVELASALHSRDWNLLATGGTARALSEAGLPVRTVSSFTGEPELFGGRVKTLHPAIHAGLLARDTPEDRAVLDARGWEAIDLVAVNLYPFEDFIAGPQSDLASAVEQIDIGGVALLRAAAKNFARVTVLCDPMDYPNAVDPSDPKAFRLGMAHKAFARTAAYDRTIEGYLSQPGESSLPLQLTAYPALELRYGENPHQRAEYYSSTRGGGPLGGELMQGRQLSYNNLLDLDAAWRAANQFAAPVAVVVKHTSPCGMATASESSEALRLAIECDPTSAFGSVVASNRPINEAFADALGDLFIECLIAPEFGPGAGRRLAARRNLRLLRMRVEENRTARDIHRVTDGFLQQDQDVGDPPSAEGWQVVTRRHPSDQELEGLRFAWLACQPVKSNAIVLSRSEGTAHFTVGIGGGQPNRVDSVRLAGMRAGDRAAGAMLASDGFFPFPDGIEVAAELGVTAVVQPGGSRRDQEVIEAADKAGLAMVFAGARHFRH
ncbi:MAG: bifunctional phosphoribosylaminoimidazolecarboxamide formyltransferase/IMP cyclohydrolase [Anaerolineae bacterium]|nr:MAG: bifunctional phosphoribosylaminoimidazolecarboxamide formyltransferase/IMP cyclohydrolase [Anaerolineae bacterium]